MFRRRILTAVVVVMFAIVSILLPVFSSNASAAQTATVGGNALKVSPVRTDLTLDPGTTKTVIVSITNLTSLPATLHAAINDFVASNDESGKPSVILDETQSAPTHSLKQFVVPIPDFKLAAGEQKDIKVTINVSKNAPGGGYYGAVRFYPATPAGDKQVNLAASVGSLILLKVNGDIVEKMQVASFDVRRGDNSAFFFTSNKNLVNVVRFRSTGNVQLAPFGRVQVKRFGKVVDSFEINNTDPRGNVLPDSVRRFSYPLKKIGAFGKYTLEGNFGYGSTGQLLTAKVTFYVVPVPYVIAGLAVILALVVLIFVIPRMIKGYNQRIIRKASRRR